MAFHLLIADDENTIRKGISNYMPWHEIDCVVEASAKNGSEAIELIKEKRPDIIITDIKMPGANGIEVAKYVHENCPELKVIILTGHAEFDYARSALRYGVSDYVLKPISKDTLMEAVRKCITQLEEERRKISLEIYRVAAFQNKTLDGGTADIEFIHAIISAFPRENYIYRRGGFLFWVLGCGPEDDDTELIHEYCHEIVETGKSLYAFDVYAGVSAVHHGLSDFALAESEALQAVLPGGSRISFFSPELSFRDRIPAALLEDLLVLENFLKAKDFEAAKKCAGSIFEQAEKSFLSLQAVKALGLHLCYILFGCFENSGFDVNKAEFLFELNLCGTSDKMKILLYGLLDRLAKELSALPARYNPAVEKAIRLIRGNYAENISLETIAVQIHINPSHLSRTFKKDCGESITDYINKVRIEKASELLSSTAMLAYEVAEAVGFNDPTYFSIVFKKYTGLSPKEFKAGR